MFYRIPKGTLSDGSCKRAHGASMDHQGTPRTTLEAYSMTERLAKHATRIMKYLNIIIELNTQELKLRNFSMRTLASEL